jgi:hypothetical protein
MIYVIRNIIHNFINRVLHHGVCPVHRVSASQTNKCMLLTSLSQYRAAPPHRLTPAPPPRVDSSRSDTSQAWLQRTKSCLHRHNVACSRRIYDGLVNCDWCVSCVVTAIVAESTCVVARKPSRGLCFILQGWVLIFWRNVDSFPFRQILALNMSQF